MYFKTLKLIGGNLFNRPRSASNRQLRSVFTSIFRLDGAPRDRTDARPKQQQKTGAMTGGWGRSTMGKETKSINVEQSFPRRHWHRATGAASGSFTIAPVHLPAISSSSFITSFSNTDGICLEKKSFSAVATAFTGISRFSMSAFGSVGENMRIDEKPRRVIVGKSGENFTV